MINLKLILKFIILFAWDKIHSPVKLKQALIRIALILYDKSKLEIILIPLVISRKDMNIELK